MVRRSGAYVIRHTLTHQNVTVKAHETGSFTAGFKVPKMHENSPIIYGHLHFQNIFGGYTPRPPFLKARGREGGGDRGRGDGEGERTNARERERKRGGEAIGGWNGRETRTPPCFLADRRL